jgi:predicted amidohydrolase
MRIALAQINPTVGDIAANTRKILEFTHRAKSQSANIVVFPELSIIGYPPKDLPEQKAPSGPHGGARALVLVTPVGLQLRSAWEIEIEVRRPAS